MTWIRCVPAALLLMLPAACASEPKADEAGLQWTACGDDENWAVAGPSAPRRAHLTVECAELRVPLTYDAPRSVSPDVAVVVVRVRDDRQHDRIGSLILNPGGPAASGVDYMPAWASWFPDELLEHFDLVTFDPRGTGLSDPIDCPDDASSEALPDVSTAAGFQELARRIIDYETSCAEHLGSAASAYGTDDVAHDLDLLRTALGDDRLTYVGWSYGARLGAHYAHLFPGKVRALVLDSPPAPESSRSSVVDAQIEAFEGAFHDYVASCAQRSSCGELHNPEQVLDRVRTRARASGIGSGRPAGDPPANEDIVVRAVLGFLASPSSWTDLDLALAEADRGDSGSLYDMVDSLEGRTPAHPDADTDAAMGVVQCIDSPSPESLEALRPAAQRLVTEHRIFGTSGAAWLLSCAGWPDSGRRTLPPPTTSTDAELLVLAGEKDPSTPLAGARALASDLAPAAVLLVSEQAGHTSFGSSPCVDERVVDYLISASAPTHGTVCP
jgi:pimeloyl-ACP methyl ester carboxylesterase